MVLQGVSARAGFGGRFDSAKAVPEEGTPLQVRSCARQRRIIYIYILRRVWSRSLSGKITLHVPCVCVRLLGRLYAPILSLCDTHPVRGYLTRRVLQVHGYVSVYEGGGWAECLRKGEDMVARSHRVMQLCAEVDRL